MNLCSFPDCSKPSRAKRGGLCVAHGKQASLGVPLRPLMARVPLAGPCLFEGCTAPRLARGYCGGHYQQAMKGMSLAPLLRNRPCALAWCGDGVVLGLEGDACKRHTQTLKHRGLTVARANELFARQGGTCATCGTADPGRRDWHIDHDHACCPGSTKNCGACVRGILCMSCNLILGHAKDDPQLLADAAIYLLKYTGVVSVSVEDENVVQLSKAGQHGTADHQATGV